MTDPTPCEKTLTPETSLETRIKGLRNPKLIRSFASDAELEAVLVDTAAKTGLSISAVIRESLRKVLIEG